MLLCCQKISTSQKKHSPALEQQGHRKPWLPRSLHCESMHWPDRVNSAVICPSIFGLHAPAPGPDFTANCSD